MLPSSWHAGCQRLEVVHPTTQLSWRVRICADAATPKLPKEVREGRAHWAAWAWRTSDAWALAADAQQLFGKLFPDVRPTADCGHAKDMPQTAIVAASETQSIA